VLQAELAARPTRACSSLPSVPESALGAHAANTWGRHSRFGYWQPHTRLSVRILARDSESVAPPALVSRRNSECPLTCMPLHHANQPAYGCHQAVEGPQFHAVLAIRDLLCADQLALIEYAPGQPGPRIVESSRNGDGRHLPPFCASKPPSHPRMLKQRFASCASGLRYGSKLQYDCVGGEGLCAQASSSFHVRN
jgi:hypothetical protein